MSNILNYGLTLTFVAPPWAYTFGITPLHWFVIYWTSEGRCPDCGGEHKAVVLRLGPFFFGVTKTHHQ